MLALLIPLSILSFFLLLQNRRSAYPSNWREHVLQSILIFGLLITTSTELLSVARALDQKGLTIVWLLAMAVPLLFCQKPLSLREAWPKILKKIAEPGSPFFLISITGILTIIGITAAFTPPNTWDSFTTHLARIAHWEQNHSVANYPTSMIKQLDYPPGSSYILLHLNILSGSDIFANLCQWWAMIMGLIGLSLIAKILGANTREQLLTALIAASVPMAILQGSSAQNEHVNSLWLIIFVYFLLKFRRDGRMIDLLTSFLGLGLAVSIKGTGLLYCLPFISWIVWERWPKDRIKTLKFPLLAILAILIVNGPFYARCLSLTGSVIPQSEVTNMINHDPSLLIVGTNVVRNIAPHLMIPYEPWNAALGQTIGALDQWDEKKIAFMAPKAKDMFREDVAGNPLHLLLIILCAILSLFAFKRAPRKKIPTHYAFAIGAAFLCFAVVVHWTLFNSRYHLAIFLLITPWIAMIIHRASPKAALITAIILTLSTLPWLFLNPSRLWTGPSNIFQTPRTFQYFANNPGRGRSYTMLMETVERSQCRDIGLALGQDSWEYPLWTIVKHWQPSVRFEHIFVTNASAKAAYPLGDFQPCAIITETPNPEPSLTLHDHTYIKTRTYPFLTLFQINDGTLTPREKLAATFSVAIEPFNIPDLSTPESQTAFIRAVTVRFKAAQEVDIATLALINPDMAQAFTPLYKTGLLNILEGLKNRNTAQIREGQKLIATWWELWMSGQLGEIKEIFIP